MGARAFPGRMTWLLVVLACLGAETVLIVVLGRRVSADYDIGPDGRLPDDPVPPVAPRTDG